MNIIYSCGHIEQIDGEKGIINHRNICPKCKEKKILEGKKLSKYLKLPKLLGTINQVENAEGIRLNWINFYHMLDEDLFNISLEEKKLIKITVNNILQNIINASWYIEKFYYKYNGILKYCQQNIMLEKVKWKVIQPSNYNDKYAILYLLYQKNLKKIFFKGIKSEKIIDLFKAKGFKWIYNKQIWEYESKEKEIEELFKEVIENIFSLGYKIYYEKNTEQIF